MTQFTSVPPGAGVNVNVVGFRALKGRVNSSRTLMALAGTDSTISMVPLPALRFPLHS